MDIATTAYSGRYNDRSFDASVASLLMFLGGEKYFDIFKSRNITQETLMELSDDDLRRLGIDDPDVRAGVIEEAKNFPIYEEIQRWKKLSSDVDLEDISTMLRDTNQHMHRIHLSMISMNLALSRRSVKEDVVADKPVTSVLNQTLDEVEKTLNKIDYAVQTKFKCISKTYKEDQQKKILVGTVGSAVIAILAVLFVRSLKHVK